MSNFRVLVAASILAAFYDTETQWFSEAIRRQMTCLLEESQGSSVEFWLAPVTLNEFFEDIEADAEYSQALLQDLITEGFYIPAGYTYNPEQPGKLEQSVEQPEIEYAIAHRFDAILSGSTRSHQNSHVSVLALEACPTLKDLLLRSCQARLEQLYQKNWQVGELNRLITYLMVDLWLAFKPQPESKPSAAFSPSNVGKYSSLAIALITLIGRTEPNQNSSSTRPPLRQGSSAESFEISTLGSSLAGGKTTENIDKLGDTNPKDGLGDSGSTIKFETPSKAGGIEAKATLDPSFSLGNFGRDSSKQVINADLIRGNNTRFILAGDDTLSNSFEQVPKVGLISGSFINKPIEPSWMLSAANGTIAQTNLAKNLVSIPNPNFRSVNVIANPVVSLTNDGYKSHLVEVSYQPVLDDSNTSTHNTSIQSISNTSGNHIITIPPSSGQFTIENFGGVGRGSNPPLATIQEVDTLQFSGIDSVVQNLLLNQNGNDLVISFEGESIEVILKNFDLEKLDNLSPETGASVQIGNILFNGDFSIQDSYDVINLDANIRQVLRHSTTTFLNDFNNQTIGFDNSDDVINGQGGNDYLDGLGGNDILRGGIGSDILIGGSGINKLTGNEGSDTFVISMDGFSQVTDFKSGEDFIGLPTGVSEQAVKIEPGTGVYSGSSLIKIDNILVMEIKGASADILLSTFNLFQKSPFEQTGWFR